MSNLTIKRDHSEAAGLTRSAYDWDESYIVTPTDPEYYVDWKIFLDEYPQYTPGQAHPDYANAIVTNVSLERDDDVPIYHAVITYTQDFATTEEAENPLNQRAKISWRSMKVMQPTLIDVHGDPLVNTAGDLFQDIQRPMSFWVCSIKKNVPGVPRWFKDYANAINESSLRLDGDSYPRHTLQLEGATIGEIIEDPASDVLYRVLSMDIFYRKDTWITRVPNRGLYEIITRTNEDDETYIERKRITSSGTPVSTPQFLDNDGKRPREIGPDGDEVIKEKLDRSDIVVLDFDTLEEKQFGNLPIT